MLGQSGFSQDSKAKPPVVLVADDSRLQRKILKKCLLKWGYTVLEAETGQAAMAICLTEDVDVILSDWMMPEMDGLEFCEAFRALDRENYGYFILLTSKDSKAEVARGLEIGADDFLTKPVNSDELRARLRAGERVLAMQKELVKKNQSIARNLTQMRDLYRAIDRDLEDAKKFQQALLPQGEVGVRNGRLSMILQCSGHVGGDMVGYYFNDRHRLGIYGFDVSGHGVGSALLTARIAGCLSAKIPAFNVAMRQLRDGGYELRPPAEIAQLLNTRLLREMDTSLYLTILLAEIDLETGAVAIAQAGHPNPGILRENGGFEYFGDGGMPVGLFDDPTYGTTQAQLDPGDRLLIYSDGFTEAENRDGAFLDEAGLERLVVQNAKANGQEFLADLVWETKAFCGPNEVGDDLSAIAFEFRPASSTRTTQPGKNNRRR